MSKVRPDYSTVATSAIPPLNNIAQCLTTYLTKDIARRAKCDPTIMNLAFGEPEFGPPEHLADLIQQRHLNYDSLLHAFKGYEQSLGSRELRYEIARWYRRRHKYTVDPETEILITHGAVEAITLAILCSSDPDDTILITDPTYMLYSRAITTLGRAVKPIIRTPDSEYVGMLRDRVSSEHLIRARGLVINSPENPTGYVLDGDDWQAVSNFATIHNLWVIHDEVYDSMAFARPHVPARCVEGLRHRAILINSFSKKFGVPGLRIGWLCGPPEFISCAAKLHDYHYLAVNMFSEEIALTLLADDLVDIWLEKQCALLKNRTDLVIQSLTTATGFLWSRLPFGAMFGFPNVSGLCGMISDRENEDVVCPGERVAEYLLKERKVAVIPGSIYGFQGNEHIRLTLCSGETTLRTAIDRIKAMD